MKEGPGCVHCIKCVDPWFSDIITVWIQEANDFLAGKPVHPGNFFLVSTELEIDQC